MDLAVGVIIGGAFGKITTSLVDDVIMPVISAVIGDVDLATCLSHLPKCQRVQR
ncbi:Large-conductance mechanosensitive channel [Moraxella caprae]|uniref:Large-conductance mechanosensitive channel n=1 Tax=Moraxella caprae TaxID=90240 RepID=A0A378QXZ8_9GAMM|nr:Large-conductance mechanosensitive channel [Moraxella caprae]